MDPEPLDYNREISGTDEVRMIIAVACDHGGLPLKSAVLEAVVEAGHTPLDLGTNDPAAVDYPDYAQRVAKVVLGGQAARGVLICGSGVGISIAANKFAGIYAAICHDTYSAHQGVEHDGMNVLCLGGRIVGTELAKELVKAFLGAHFSTEERHIRRTGKTRQIESRGQIIE
jgi:ribose 5-phosphate isomerase B